MINIAPHQQNAINYISEKLYKDENVLALLLSGSIAHGFNTEYADVDMNIVVTEENRMLREANHDLCYWESGEQFYKGGYFDGVYITLPYLSLVAKQGNEPTRFALGDAGVLFDKTGKVAEIIQQIGHYDKNQVPEKSARFYAQFEVWHWWCGEAFRKNDNYVLNTAVQKLVLFAGRLILLENRIFFPYHKWFISALESAPNKPDGFMDAFHNLIENKTPENVKTLYEMVKSYKDWMNGRNCDWGSYNIRDVINFWTRGEDFVDHI